MFKIKGIVSILIVADDPKDAATKLAMLMGVKLTRMLDSPVRAEFDTGAIVISMVPVTG